MEKLEVVWTIDCPKDEKRVDVWPTCRACEYCQATIPAGRPYIICDYGEQEKRRSEISKGDLPGVVS